MKKTYSITMSKDGNRFSSGVSLTVQADSEYDAIQEAQRRHPDLKVASVKEK